MTNALKFVPVLNRLDLVSPSVAACVREWRGSVPVDDLWVAEIDPNFAGGTDFCARYGVKYTEGANCVVVEGKRAVPQAPWLLLSYLLAAELILTARCGSASVHDR